MTAATAHPARWGSWRVVSHELRDARSYWTSVVITGILTPLMFVLAMGVGLGSVVNRHSDVLGVPYLQFVAPALLAAAALQTATSSATFPVMSGFKWLRFYHGMAATPLSPRQICDGKLIWITLRTTFSSLAYLIVMAAIGGAKHWGAVLDVPIGTLTGLAFAAPVLAVAATVEGDGQAFTVIFRFVVTPMFLFAGTFYPVSQLPGWGRVVAYVSPLWHGVDLARAAALDQLSAGRALGHVAYLLAWLVVGTIVARHRFAVRLQK